MAAYDLQSLLLSITSWIVFFFGFAFLALKLVRLVGIYERENTAKSTNRRELYNLGTTEPQTRGYLACSPDLKCFYVLFCI